MTRFRFLVLFLILLLLAGCGKATPVDKTAGDKETEQPAVESHGDLPAVAQPEGGSGNSAGTVPPEMSPGDTTGAAQPAESSVPVDQGHSEDASKIVIKTDNPVSNQEAGAMLDAVDKQLDELMDTLDRLDELSEEDLQD